MASLPPLASLPLWLALVGPSFAQGDPETIERILVEGKEHSQVWATLAHLSDDIGTRLTGSTRLTKANEWTHDEFQRFGLEAHLSQWGTVPVGFDRGPSHARMVAPSTREFEFTTDSYGAGTNGPLRAPVRALPTTMAELEEIGFDLEGCWILCPDEERTVAKAAREE